MPFLFPSAFGRDGRASRVARPIAIVPQLVAPALLHRANARVGAVFGAADTAGTCLGTAVVAVVGAAEDFWLDSLSYLASACCAARIPEPGRPVPAAGGGRPPRRLAWVAVPRSGPSGAVCSR
ncbi:MFS transporter [Streptomyces vinaceus]|uniref:hypothetical protein n=1 Tax=Streptomyces vinaceus TaxID=1960 RepID=UPI003681A8C6